MMERRRGFIFHFADVKARVNILLPTARSHGKGALIEFIFISPLENMAALKLMIVITIIIAIIRIICALLSANIWCDVQ